MTERAWLRKKALVMLWKEKRCTSLRKDLEYERYITNLKTAIVGSRNEMSRKCLRNFQSTKGSTFVLKTKLDLVDMKRLCTKYNRKTYKYVLSIIHVFSRYHWLVPLQTKKSSHLACEPFDIYTEHGAPARLPRHEKGGCELDPVTSRLRQILKPRPEGRPLLEISIWDLLGT